MPLRIPTHTIILHRDGKRVVVRPAKEGQKIEPFPFTDAEIKDITASSPTALRKPINEEANVVVEPKAPSVKDKQPPKVGGNAPGSASFGDKTDDL